ncbi:MAG: hypothetical protein U0T73_00755 [Chitinophagales bacterium]
MKKWIIIIGFAISVSSTFAQSAKVHTPGFLGMRASIKYDFGIMVPWENSDAITGSMPYMYHTAEIAYAVTRRYELALRYSRMDFNGTSAVMGYENNGVLVQGGPYHDRSSQTYSSNEAALLLKIYRSGSGYIAPVGRYAIVGISYLHSVHDLDLTESDYYNTETIKFHQKVISHDVFIKAGVGRNFVVARRLLISVEGMINFPLSNLIKMAPKLTDASNSTGDPFNVTKFTDKVNGNIALKQLVQFKIGFGSLLF